VAFFLKAQVLADGAEIVADVEPSRRLDAGQYPHHFHADECTKARGKRQEAALNPSLTDIMRLL
jgi:hypothetical protein